MSATIEVPKGLDKLDAAEQALYESMRDDASGPDAPTEDAPLAPAAASEPEPADTEIEIELDPEPTPTTQRQKMVPHSQLHAVNERRKAAEAEAAAAEAKAAESVATLERERAVVQARVETIARMMDTQAPPAPAVAAPTVPELPDVAVDPVGYFRGVAERQAKQIDDLKGIVTGVQESQQEQRRVAELRQWGTQQEQAFEATEPSYRAAMTHLLESRHRELKAYGVANAAERQRIITEDVNIIAKRAQVEGANFAERLYKASVERGFAKAPPAAPAAPVAPAIPPLDADPEPAAIQRAQRIQEGRENSTTLGSIGAALPARLSAAKIADMTESQFATLVERLKGNPTALRDLLGH